MTLTVRHQSHISAFLVALLALLVASCDKAPRGVIGESKMTDLIIDLELAEAYIDNHPMDFPNDSTKLVMKQSVFKKHGVNAQLYDTSLVWYAHNMDAYTKVYTQVISRLEQRRDKLQKKGSGNGIDREMSVVNERPGQRAGVMPKRPSAHGDTIDIWQGVRTYALTQGMRNGFISFDFSPDEHYKRGDRYQLAYKLLRCSNEFKVSLNIDYTDGVTHQVARPVSSEGWVTIDIQSDTARQVSRIYGYVRYKLKPHSVAVVDSLMLLRSRCNSGNYAFIRAQKEFKH